MPQAGPVGGLKVALVVVASSPAFAQEPSPVWNWTWYLAAPESASHIKEKVGSEREAEKLCGADGMVSATLVTAIVTVAEALAVPLMPSLTSTVRA